MKTRSLFVDTSIWINYFRGSNSALIARMQNLLDEDRVYLPYPVKLELLAGCKKTDLFKMERVLSALPLFVPSESTWDLAERFVKKTASAGHYFGFADLLLGACAAELGSRIWSQDGDFKRMQKLGLIEIFAVD